MTIIVIIVVIVIVITCIIISIFIVIVVVFYSYHIKTLVGVSLVQNLAWAQTCQYPTVSQCDMYSVNTLTLRKQHVQVLAQRDSRTASLRRQWCLATFCDVWMSCGMAGVVLRLTNASLHKKCRLIPRKVGIHRGGRVWARGDSCQRARVPGFKSVANQIIFSRPLEMCPAAWNHCTYYSGVVTDRGPTNVHCYTYLDLRLLQYLVVSA